MSNISFNTYLSLYDGGGSDAVNAVRYSQQRI